MADKTSIKSPGGDVVTPKGPTRGSSGIYNGEDGYKKRTSTPNGPDEKTYDGAKPRGNLDIKTPATDSNGRK